MIRDPFDREIHERLNGPLHEEAFERCAQDLLRKDYPTLVPVRGGTDGGMDGVTADLDEKQIVLVVTVGKDVKRNLKTSLMSLTKNKNPCRRIISATSQQLSPKKQQDLRDAAAKLGYNLIQIYERAAMANLLHESPKWCKELLNLTGDPPALSIIPRSVRPAITNMLIGRHGDACWLENTVGDRLLVGQPGSGKTLLLSALAKGLNWRFVVTSDLGQIANGIRSQGPAAVILDDAHINLIFLRGLRRLLRELNVETPIIATCWPGVIDCVRMELSLPREKIRELGPLTRLEMVRVLESARLTRPDRLVAQILNQADGRPGLAITLADVCMEGDERDLKDVILGGTLVQSVRTTFESLVGPHVIELLASFALGGRAGMKIQDVADFLGKSFAETRSAMIGLAAGGVVYDVDGRHLSVRPPELRYALVRDVFFSGAMSLDISPLLTRVPSASETTATLAAASHYGANIPKQLMERMLEHADLNGWETYAWLGREEARYAISKHPELVGLLARPTLHNAPEMAIPVLLKNAVGDTRSLHSHPDHPLREIENWIKGGLPGTYEPMDRREALLEAAREWIASGEDTTVGIQAIGIALTPAFESNSCDPVFGDKVTVRLGVLPLKEVNEIASLWTRACQLLSSINYVPWQHVIAVITDWAYPQSLTRVELPDELYCRMREIAVGMIRDVATIGHDSIGLIHVAANLACELGIDLGCSVDQDYAVLFPSLPRDLTDYVKSQSVAMMQLAERWSVQQPRFVLERINQLEAHAQQVGESNRQTPLLARELAQRVSNPLDWIEAILETDANGDLVAPFLLRASSLVAANWEAAAERCLLRETTRCATVSVIVTLQEPPEEILDRALSSLAGMAKQVEWMCSQNAVPTETVRRLLNHGDDEIASYAAIGIWVADPKGSVLDVLQQSWEAAILRGNPREFWLGDILNRNSGLAFRFLATKVHDNKYIWSNYDHATRQAVGALSSAQRRDLIIGLPDDFSSRGAVAILVGTDTEVYKTLLGDARLKRYYTVPLGGRPNEGNWVERAKAALDVGIDTKDVAAGAFHNHISWSGKESEMWQEWVNAFETIRFSEDNRIREVAEHGIEIASKNRDQAVKREREGETNTRP